MYDWNFIKSVLFTKICNIANSNIASVTLSPVEVYPNNIHPSICLYLIIFITYKLETYLSFMLQLKHNIFLV